MQDDWGSPAQGLDEDLVQVTPCKPPNRARRTASKISYDRPLHGGGGQIRAGGVLKTGGPQSAGAPARLFC
jgi:hypothetical protein